jgi:Na+-driven multidrug efflux pump
VFAITNVSINNSQAFAVQGGVRGFLSLFFPLLGISFSNYLFLMIEKILLARVSSLSMEAAVSAMYACQIFQGTGIACAMMAQVFIARWHGERSWTMIGPGTWQFIWFSFASMILTVPGSFFYGQWYFQKTEVAFLALPYYHFLIGWNFLYPLGMVLSCFYLGQGKARFVLFVNLLAQVLKIGLGYFFIFGCSSWIPPFGLMGGAISTILAQLVFCIILFCSFLNRKNRTLFHSHEWRLRPVLFFECIRSCFSRAVNRILNYTSWAAIAHLMIAKGGEYLLIMSVGGFFCLLQPLLSEALCQTQITTVSYLIGAGKTELIKKAIRSGFIVVSAIGCIVSIPFLFFPLEFTSLMFPDLTLDPATIKTMLLGIWVCIIFFIFNTIPLSHVLAFKDFVFPLIMGGFNWINGYLLMYCFLEIFLIPATLFWFALALMHGSTLMIYLLRMMMLRNRKALQPTPS